MSQSTKQITGFSSMHKNATGTSSKSKVASSTTNVKPLNNTRKANSVDPRDRHSMQAKQNYSSNLIQQKHNETDRDWKLEQQNAKKNSTQ